MTNSPDYTSWSASLHFGGLASWCLFFNDEGTMRKRNFEKVRTTITINWFRLYQSVRFHCSSGPGQTLQPRLSNRLFPTATVSEFWTNLDEVWARSQLCGLEWRICLMIAAGFRELFALIPACKVSKLKLPATSSSKHFQTICRVPHSLLPIMKESSAGAAQGKLGSQLHSSQFTLLIPRF